MLTLFLLVAAISFVGSLHPGTVNIAVLQTTLAQSRRAGLWLAAGGSLPEIGYSALAAGGAMLLPMGPGWSVVLTYAPVAVLLVAGLVAFRQQPVALRAAVAPVVEAHSVPAFSLFWKGIVLGGTNPQLLPFWSAVWLYLSRAPAGGRPIGGQLLGLTNTQGSQWVFAVSTAVGAFAWLAGVVWLADRLRHRVLPLLGSAWLNRLTGAVFVGMGLWQLIHILL
ncbi:LysE family translocator [Fibrella arboris]|uniref:LysE family translocator n=1 Tax=Fibrella arboris TaxID=3242486 RepID=UPI003520CC05